MVEGRTASRPAAGLAGMIAVLLVAATVFLVLPFDTPLPEEMFGFRGWGLFLAAAFGGAGFLVASRVPANPIGWLLLVSGIGIATQELAAQYSNYGAYDSPGVVPWVDVAAWIPEWLWIPSMAIDVVCVPLIYPNGRLLSSLGFDLDAVARGSGLQGIADRLAALGGELTIRSTPGHGTTVAGRLPTTFRAEVPS